MTNGEDFEKTFVFGGITHSKIAPMLTNKEKMERAKRKANANSKEKLKIHRVSPRDMSEASSRMDELMVPEEAESPFMQNIPESSHLSNDLYVLEVRQIL